MRPPSISPPSAMKNAPSAKLPPFHGPLRPPVATGVVFPPVSTRKEAWRRKRFPVRVTGFDNDRRPAIIEDDAGGKREFGGDRLNRVARRQRHVGGSDCSGTACGRLSSARRWADPIAAAQRTRCRPGDDENREDPCCANSSHLGPPLIRIPGIEERTGACVTSRGLSGHRLRGGDRQPQCET